MKNHPIKKVPGTYALILENKKSRNIQVGKLGSFSFPPGWYVYTGSAFGPGGLASRVGRHFKFKKKCRWHIDYLSAIIPVVRVWYTTSPIKTECQWANSRYPLEADTGCHPDFAQFRIEPPGCIKHLAGIQEECRSH